MRKHIMKVRYLRALTVGAVMVIGAGLLAGATALAAEKAETKQPSAKLQKPLHDAQEDLKAKKYADAISKLKAAEGMDGKTPYDQHIINDFLAFAYIKTTNYADAAKAIEAEIDDGFTPQAEIPQKVKELTEINYQIKNYDKAIEFGNRAIKGGFADEQIRTIVGQSYYLKGDWKGTLKFEEAAVENQVKAGETPKKQTLELILSACVKINDSACETRALERMVTYYPQPDYWYQLLYGMRQQTTGNDADTLQTYRLMSEVDVLKSADDYSEMAQLAIEAGSPGEAQHALEKGFAKNVFTEQRQKERNQRLLDNAKKQAATDQASLAKVAQEAEAAKTGQKDVGVGIAYLGYGQYDKAAEFLSKGIAKGGLKDEGQAELLLGIAQLKAGHKDEALKAFKAVKGDAALERLANLWSLHAKEGSGASVSQTQKVKGAKKGSQSQRVARARAND
jgi:tetratricopeptide (TPR) repeat protein